MAGWHGHCEMPPAMLQQPIKLKHEFSALAQVLFGIGILTLVLVGIGGTIYKVMSPEGWLAQAFGRSLSAGAAALGALIVVGLLAWFSRSVTSSHDTRNRVADLLVYAFAAAGIVYLSQLWMKGTF